MYRTEEDLLGKKEIPADALYGIHMVRAMENFPFVLRPVPEAMIRSYGTVKEACIRTCADLGCWKNSPPKVEAMLKACREMGQGLLCEHIRTDLMQGGAGTSLNMNVNEVLANRSLQLLNQALGRYDIISPTEDINRYQSTNDTFPTALKVAAIVGIQGLERKLLALQEAFQQKEKAFAHIIRMARTEYQDAVLTTLGRQFGAYAEAFNRDRWRICKSVERLRSVNLGGTAIGTGLAAERDYIFRVTDRLRELTGIGLARSENLLEATQNCDVFVEVSGILKACAASLLKVCGDLRLLSSGPDSGLGEIHLPQRQAGSSIMPGKVNPVIPEAVSQAAMQVMGNDAVIAQASAAGSLELNAFLPLIAANLLENIEFLATACDILCRNCIEGIEANELRCKQLVENSTAMITALLPVLGYERCSLISKQAKQENKTIRQVVIEGNLLSEKDFEQLISPEAVCRLGFIKTPKP